MKDNGVHIYFICAPRAFNRGYPSIGTLFLLFEMLMLAALRKKTMVLNLLCNRCSGRGFEAAASTKNCRFRRLLMGAKWDRLALKDLSCTRHCTTVIGLK